MGIVGSGVQLKIALEIFGAPYAIIQMKSCSIWGSVKCSSSWYYLWYCFGTSLVTTLVTTLFNKEVNACIRLKKGR